MMTIRQKVMKGWAENWQRVAVTEKNAEPIWGKIATFNPIDNSFCLFTEDAEKKVYRIVDLIDIGFLHEDRVNLADDGSIMGDFQKERTAALAEMFDNPDPETSIYPTTAFYARLDRAVEKALERQRHVIQSTITPESPGSEPAETESEPPADDDADDSIEYHLCCTVEKQRAVIERLTTENVELKRSLSEVAVDTGADENLEAPERWEWYDGDEKIKGLYCRIGDATRLLFQGTGYLTDDDKAVMAAALDMLDALRRVRDAWQGGEVDMNSADDENAVRLFNEIVIGALKKAEGDQGEKRKATEATPAM